MLLTYRFKLAPTKAQYAALSQLCEDQRQLYNAALQERVEAWKKQQISITKLDQFNSLSEIRSFDRTYSSVPSRLSRWTISRVDDAFKGFFSRVKRGTKAGFPRFKPRSRWKSFGFSEWSGIRLNDEKLLFSGLTGRLKVRLHRPIPDGASLKACTFTRTGRFWYVAIQMDVPVAEGHAKPETIVGIDVGIEHLAFLSDGTYIENPRIGKAHQRKVRVAQRALTRCKRGSKRRIKVKEKLALLKRKTANARATYLHQASAKITRNYAFIGVEKLNVKNMTGSAKGTVEEPGKNVRQKAGINRAMLDASVSRLISFVDYKAERAGGQMVKVNSKNTSQECFFCESIVEKSLDERQHQCPHCGVDLPRDYNSALVVLKRACKAHGRAMPPRDANLGHQPVRCPGKMVAEAA
ncbi:RNA-guided endonuclease TnpB family protein [Rhizobium sp. MHM7A]|uniref:RNA-guided endonuclease InsQ/TnpB family protein n=1 Tax=Rhizobium sp. MHM7A TaxID=2583233 RepID=UPI0011067F1F|nr:RNA-guided endonuclease TnpB family protein [Rhizobium sp. MHM7A]TLX16861.1 IS200/IS605 family element transposase accessory protein TnpB [Rhizobium sp. MHM7A]